MSRLLVYSFVTNVLSMPSLSEYAPGLGYVAHNIDNPNLLIFIGGLGDQVQTVPYVEPLSRALNSENWGVVEILTQSSGSSWGTGSISRDALDIAKAVTYFKEKYKPEKIAIQGHSTGCQDVIYYLTQGDVSSRPFVNGAILQASVSDREAFLKSNNSEFYKESLDYAKARYSEICKDAALTEIVPEKYYKKFFGTPISVYRWLALFDVRGQDDYFSSDLTAEDFAKTFGKIDEYGKTNKLLVAYSGKDEFVPDFVNKEDLMSNFKAATSPHIWSKHSAVIAGASHNCGPTSDPEAQGLLIKAVKNFLSEL